VLEAEDLSIIDADMNSVVELGDFTVMIGSSSDNILLNATITQN
jgi:beta-glucosidase